VLGPASRVLIALLIIASAGLLVVGARLRPVLAKIACGTLAIVIAMVGGIAAVNHYYGYYLSWGQLRADFSDSAGNLGVAAAVKVTKTGPGSIGWINLPGKRSGYDRSGLLYLPPQYSQPAYADIRFPVVELFHGTPGTPLTWDTGLRINQVADNLLARHLIGPMVLVMPSINGAGREYQDCVNGPDVHDDTYLTQDVRTDMLANYRVSADPDQWAVGGYSSGGYCAANLALRHRASFGAAAVIEGYFRAADGPAGTALNGSKVLEAANSPLYTADKLQAGSGPLPAFWVAAGTDDGTDYQLAGGFTAAMDRVEPVSFVKVLNGRDTGSAWAAVLPDALIWLWQQLAPPDLRVLFPVHANARNVTVKLSTRPGRHSPADSR
jgi:poly(3-hydroxybutyrate) depolymerase